MRARTIVIAAVAGGVALAGIGVGVWFAVSGSQEADDDWSAYPGSAFRDSSEVVDGDSLEQVSAAGDAFLSEYRDALTAALGLTWTEVAAGYSERDLNGYGGTSLLHVYDGGVWRGEVTLDDPAARQTAQDLFAQLTPGDEFYASNDLYLDNPAEALGMFGAEQKPLQPLWSLRDRSDGLVVSAEVLDRSLIVTDFEPGSEFSVPPAPEGTFVVVIRASGYALLSEQDRDEFIEQVAPWEGRTKPGPAIG